MFHVKHQAKIPNYAILQNNPMDQKIVALIQRHSVYQFRSIFDQRTVFGRGKAGFSVR